MRAIVRPGSCAASRNCTRPYRARPCACGSRISLRTHNPSFCQSSAAARWPNVCRASVTMRNPLTLAFYALLLQLGKIRQMGPASRQCLRSNPTAAKWRDLGGGNRGSSGSKPFGKRKRWHCPAPPADEREGDYRTVAPLLHRNDWHDFERLLDFSERRHRPHPRACGGGG
jgi:hypothetical protein